MILFLQHSQHPSMNIINMFEEEIEDEETRREEEVLGCAFSLLCFVSEHGWDLVFFGHKNYGEPGLIITSWHNGGGLGNCNRGRPFTLYWAMSIWAVWAVHWPIGSAWPFNLVRFRFHITQKWQNLWSVRFAGVDIIKNK